MREVRRFFGDAEHVFKLDPGMIVELERKAGAGIGAIMKRFLAAEFTHADLTETLRLGLIGGGSDPQDAAALVDLYAERLSITRLYETALPVIEAAFFEPEGTADA